MRAFGHLTLAVLTVTLGVVAYELTMTVTMLGGWLPLGLIIAAPLLGYALGRIE